MGCRTRKCRSNRRGLPIMADSASPDEMPPALARPVTVSEFRAHLAEMIGRAERGEEVTISRGTQPVAKLVPLGRRRRLGACGS